MHHRKCIHHSLFIFPPPPPPSLFLSIYLSIYLYIYIYINIYKYIYISLSLSLVISPFYYKHRTFCLGRRNSARYHGTDTISLKLLLGFTKGFLKLECYLWIIVKYLFTSPSKWRGDRSLISIYSCKVEQYRNRLRRFGNSCSPCLHRYIYLKSEQ